MLMISGDDADDTVTLDDGYRFGTPVFKQREQCTDRNILRNCGKVHRHSVTRAWRREVCRSDQMGQGCQKAAMSAAGSTTRTADQVDLEDHPFKPIVPCHDRNGREAMRAKERSNAANGRPGGHRHKIDLPSLLADYHVALNRLRQNAPFRAQRFPDEISLRTARLAVM